jgi:predicted CXXCH cytochrome family protein
VHSPKSVESQLVKRTQTELCATCHRVQVVKTERAVAHMPVREGKMSCSSCHNPHGSISNVKALKVGSSIGESCMSCHTEMRGPMLWEHAPVRENCATCHDPDYPTQEQGLEDIEKGLRAFYTGKEAIDDSELARTISGLRGLYRRNVFPAMKVTFGVYPDNIGHLTSTGCFRCHDGDHTAADGSTIGADCEYCHK